MSYGNVAALSVSLKQKINTLSSTGIETKTETVAISDGMPKNKWVLYLTIVQGEGSER